MQASHKSFLSIIVLCFSTMAFANNKNDVFGKPVFFQRAQEDDLARHLVGEVHNLIRCDLCDCFNGIFSGVVEYTSSFNKKDLGRFFFFNGTDTMTFGGQNIAPENKDVNGINFLLSDNFLGDVTAHPHIENIIIDFNLRLNLYEWACGLYFELDIPINWTRWGMKLTEKDSQLGSTISADSLGNMNTEQAPYDAIIPSWVGNELFFDVKEPLMFAKIDGSRTRTGVANLQLVLGYNFYCTDYGHFGLNFRATTPTGNRPNAEFVFEPIVGNRKHFSLGAGISAHRILWTNECDSSLSIWLEGVGYHLFNSKERRTFDFKNNGIGSRYLLLKRFDAINVYADEIIRGPNITTLESKTSVDFSGEIVVLTDYQKCGFTIDLGYNLWGRTREKIKLKEEIVDNFGIKGDTLTSGSSMNKTNSSITINGANGSINGDGDDPVYISTSDLDLEAAAHPSALSHKVFAHVGYAWDKCDYEPFVGMGGMAEFSGKGNRALSQWGIWAKGGVFFT